VLFSSLKGNWDIYLPATGKKRYFEFHVTAWSRGLLLMFVKGTVQEGLLHNSLLTLIQSSASHFVGSKNYYSCLLRRKTSDQKNDDVKSILSTNCPHPQGSEGVKIRSILMDAVGDLCRSLYNVQSGFMSKSRRSLAAPPCLDCMWNVGSGGCMVALHQVLSILQYLRCSLDIHAITSDRTYQHPAILCVRQRPAPMI
jgi:hypothetical protein